jgi:hypothetical protein
MLSRHRWRWRGMAASASSYGSEKAAASTLWHWRQRAVWQRGTLASFSNRASKTAMRGAQSRRQRKTLGGIGIRRSACRRQRYMNNRSGAVLLSVNSYQASGITLASRQAYNSGAA